MFLSYWIKRRKILSISNMFFQCIKSDFSFRQKKAEQCSALNISFTLQFLNQPLYIRGMPLLSGKKLLLGLSGSYNTLILVPISINHASPSHLFFNNYPFRFTNTFFLIKFKHYILSLPWPLHIYCRYCNLDISTK